MNYKKFGYAAVVAVTAAILVVGSAVPGEAKSKKKAEAAPPPSQVFCFHERKPVCAVKGDQKFTYANACFAARDGAKMSKPGECKPAKATKKSKKAGKKPAKKK